MSGPQLAAGAARPTRGRRTLQGRIAWGLVAALLPLAVASCAKFDAALGQQWAVVNFKPNTSVATVLEVRTACSHVPNVRPEPLPKVRSAMNMVYALQYRTDNASNADLARLQECLQKFSSVTGVDFQDSGDAG